MIKKGGFTQHVLYRACYNAYASCNLECHERYRSYQDLGTQFKFKDVQDMIDYMLPIWSIATRKYPNKKLMMERIDLSGHFEKGNLRIIPKEQRSNTYRHRHKSRDYSNYKSSDFLTEKRFKNIRKREKEYAQGKEDDHSTAEEKLYTV